MNHDLSTIYPECLGLVMRFRPASMSLIGGLDRSREKRVDRLATVRSTINISDEQTTKTTTDEGHERHTPP